MNTYRRTLLSALLSCLLIAFSPAGSAEEQEHHSYGYYMGHKVLNGFANIFTSWLEIPKNTINATRGKCKTRKASEFFG